MPNHQLEKKLEHARRKILIYEKKWPTLAGGQALKFVDSNFSAQGWRGNTLIPWKRTKSGKANKLGHKRQGILINTGRLRRGNRMQTGTQQVRIYNNVKYARLHNEGFKGVVNVKEYTRRRFGKGTFDVGEHKISYGESYSLRTHRKLKNKKVETGRVKVKAHTMRMNMPMRQFMPNRRRGSAILEKKIRDMTQKDILKILKTVR